ncbi:MAG TPA: trehalose-6-phosphate synthase [Candidatus Eisenbacteria bacterium]|nr:trehalose-6-phosphate synthase [Candidatus Eisenbacteria bacterium]
MKITLRLIFFLVSVIALAAVGLSFWQAQQEEARLKNELERRASVIADSLKESIEPLLSRSSPESLQRIVNKFSNRERLLGVSVADFQGNLLAVSADLESSLKDSPKILEASLQEVERSNSEYGEFVKLGSKQMHLYSLPLSTDANASHVLTLFHDRSYITERVKRIWINSFWRTLIQSLLIALTTLVIIYLSVMTPIKRTTDWIRRLRRGEAVEEINPKHKVLLGPLAGEISKMAKSLEAARLAAEEEARLRQSSESLWTPERLKEFVKVRLGGRPLFVVSNREPYMHLKKGKEIECIVPASGLVTAVEPVLKACGGTWIAQGSGSGDRETVDKDDKLKVPPEEPQYVLRRVWVTKEEEEGYYYGFSNEGLWPLCHIAHIRPTFRAKDWVQYQAVNKKFAEAAFEELEGTNDPCVLVQDNHFALLPSLIKSKRPDARVAIFWHIPWPNPESFGICPWQKEILEGMLGADIIGFHTQFHCNNFIDTVDRVLESRIDREHFTVTREGHTTWIKPFPISIDFVGTAPSKNSVNGDGNNKETLLGKYGVQAQFMGVGVERLDYIKGILERFRGIESFLESNPFYIGKFTFVQLGAPSRTAIPKYAEFVADIEKEAQRINERFKTKAWSPIVLLIRHHSHAEIQPFYKAADLCLVTSLHDGMNLVAKEYVMSRDDEKGVLILSKFTGAARELTDALIVNPYDVIETAQAIKNALEMKVDEQTERMKSMRETLKERNIYKWASDLVGELARVRLSQTA